MTVDVAFVGHLDGPEAYRDALTALRGDDLRPPELADVVARVPRMPPMPICTFTVSSLTGVTRRAAYVDAFLLVADGWSIPAAARKVSAACAEAVRLGARLVALGGFTSIVGELASLAPPGAAFTTGNTLTAAVIAAQVAACAPPEARVAVVGAAGDVGSGVARILAARGHPLLLSGRKPAPVEVLASELGATAGPFDALAPGADVVVLVASAARGGVSLQGVRPDARVLDAGHPPNGSGGLAPRARAGRIVHACPPRGGLAAFLDHAGPGRHHACLAEAEVLALEDRYEPFSVGRGGITPARAEEILAIAARHGVTPAPVEWT
ncbi:MAG: NAD(P)-binding domain-containing protein [Myxococcota bacterium]